jgi:hypothetical protein
MANYSKDAVVEIRNYLWHKLKQENVLSANDYLDGNGNTIVPVIPVQQVPEMTTFFLGLTSATEDNKTHIVYDKIGISYEENWTICCEQVVFTVYAIDYNKITIIRNFMMDLFRRMDDSAKEVNAWSGKSPEFKFHSIYIADISPTQPSQEIQGFLAEEIVLELKYSRHADIQGRFL